MLSETDARLEYEQLKLQNQVYFGPFTEGLIKLQPGTLLARICSTKHEACPDTLP